MELLNLLIAVESCMDHADREKAILDTWGNHHTVHFFNGEDLDVPDDYLSLPAKTKAICNWAREFDFLAKVDTDTYLSIPRLLDYDTQGHDYIGYELDWLSKPGYASGPCYLLSHKALNILADADWSKFSGYGHESSEDVMVGSILKAHGIIVHHDDRFALYRDVLPENDVISSHLSSRTAYKVEMMHQAHKKAMGL